MSNLMWRFFAESGDNHSFWYASENALDALEWALGPVCERICFHDSVQVCMSAGRVESVLYTFAKWCSNRAALAAKTADKCLAYAYDDAIRSHEFYSARDAGAAFSTAERSRLARLAARKIAYLRRPPPSVYTSQMAAVHACYAAASYSAEHEHQEKHLSAMLRLALNCD